MLTPWDLKCDRCGHWQRVVLPWLHIPICAGCRKPMRYA